MMANWQTQIPCREPRNMNVMSNSVRMQIWRAYSAKNWFATEEYYQQTDKIAGSSYRSLARQAVHLWKNIQRLLSFGFVLSCYSTNQIWSIRHQLCVTGLPSLTADRPLLHNELRGCVCTYTCIYRQSYLTWIFWFAADSLFCTACLAYFQCFCCEDDMAQTVLDGSNRLALDSHIAF